MGQSARLFLWPESWEGGIGNLAGRPSGRTHSPPDSPDFEMEVLPLALVSRWVVFPVDVERSPLKIISEGALLPVLSGVFVVARLLLERGIGSASMSACKFPPLFGNEMIFL